MFQPDHAALAVLDLSRSRAFYELLGGRVVSKPSSRFLEVMLGELRLHIIPTEPGQEGAADATRGAGVHHLCVSVTSQDVLEDVCARVNASPLVSGWGPVAIEDSEPLGAEPTEHAEERPPRKALYVRDPDGIMLEFRCYQ